ncbi:hypothetical protein C7212DRAFT_307392 [Tuber magnatum]|uniref:Uncharacterized protein n=1 Tax=Tuber magnatum TaxID=42249 RepID=A0A317T5Y6_9PEZI|nr:hypothetical protein C7212DRAFT_307392 [Tuber magnatum]
MEIDLTKKNLRKSGERKTELDRRLNNLSTGRGAKADIAPVPRETFVVLLLGFVLVPPE